MQEQPTKRSRPRGIYALPSLFTLAALFAGFYAVLASTHGRFEAAAIAIFAAMLLDGFDGRVARMTRTQTAFGAELDSLSDMVAFGVAPSLVAYHWVLSDLGKIGWLAAFVFTAAAALRLARFNTQLGVADKRYFQGLPSPSAAAVIAGGVWISEAQDVSSASLAWPAALVTVTAGLLMVSNFRYLSFKELDLRGRIPFILAVVVMLIFALFVIHPPMMLFLAFVTYAASGPVWTLVRLRQRRALRRGRGRAGTDSDSDRTSD